jgi:hypothetical protein
MLRRALAALVPAVVFGSSVSHASSPGRTVEDSAPVRIALRAVGGVSQVPQTVEVVAESLDRDQSVSAARRFSLRPSSDVVRLPRGKWRLLLSAADVWIEDRTIEIRSGGEERVTLRVWPAGKMVARLAMTGAGQMPKDLRVGFRGTLSPDAPPASEDTPNQGTSVCPVSTARVSCRLPVGEFAMRIAAAGFAPTYRWAVPIGPIPKNLGTLELVSGGSTMGYLEDQDGRPRSGVRIALFTPEGQAVVERSYLRSVLRADIRSLEATTDRRGFFQITGMSPGRYQLLARDAGGFLASATTEIREGLETRLSEAMVLTPPATVDVFVDPPQPPGISNWTVSLQNIDTSPSEQTVRRVVPETGHVSIENLAEGRYVLTIETKGHQNWSAEEVDIQAPRAHFDISLQAIRVTGRLRVGSKPVAGSILFGGHHHSPSVELQSNEEGVFSGSLPRAGRWRVEVEAPTPPIKRSLKDVELKERGDGTYYVDIDLPATELRGQVVDESYRPVEVAIVDVKPLGGEDFRFQVRVDPEGRFELWGLPESPVLVSAAAPGIVPLASDSLPVTPSSGASATTIQLVVRPRKRLVARVVIEGTTDPVVGAFVKVTPLGPTLTMRSSLSNTDADGRFEAFLPPNTQAVDVTFGSQARSVGMVRIITLDDTEKTLPLAPAGGRLVLESAESGEQNRLVALFHNGATESVSYLKHAGVAEEDGITIAVSPLAPGAYTACLVTSNSAGLGLPPPEPGGCAAGTLLPGAELVLRVPGGGS